MQFANSTLLFGLAALAIPVLIHLLTRHQAKPLPWGAMQFLMGSVVGRNRRMLLEEALLLVVRCLLVALLALALALPFLPASSPLTAALVLPAVLAGAAALGAGAAMASLRRWRWSLYLTGIILLGAAMSSMAGQLLRGAPADAPRGRHDIALVLDGSPSMHLAVQGQSNFQRAQQAALELLQSLPAADRASLVVAGAPPIVAMKSPSYNRAALEQAIRGASPGGGLLSAADSLRAAARTLAESHAASRTIVLITDGQRAGWGDGADPDWDAVRAAVAEAGPDTQLLVLPLSLPRTIHNLQVCDVQLPATVLAPGRAAEVVVHLANTGTDEVAEGFEVQLAIDGKIVAQQKGPALAAGTSGTVKFQHTFSSSGLHGLEARALLKDDFPWDNRAAAVAQVFAGTPVLLVEGNPAPRFFDRSGAFVEVALSPRPGPEPGPGHGPGPGVPGAPPGAPAGNAGAKGKVQASQPGLFSVTTCNLPELADVSGLVDYKAVILSDVPRLPMRVAMDLVRFVENGGGLLVLPGGRCEPEFYNHWKTLSSAPVLPAQLTERRIATQTGNRFGIAMGTLKHPALRWPDDANQSDLESAVISAYWRLTPDPHDNRATVGGALYNGDPLLVERQLARGRVLMTSISLDRNGGNLPTLQAFLPLVNELAQHLVQFPKTEMQTGPAGGAILLSTEQPFTGRQSRLSLRESSATFAEQKATFQAKSPAVETGLQDKPVAQFKGTPKPQPVPLTLRDGKVFAQVPAVSEPGLYGIELPPAMRDGFRESLSDGAVPLAVKCPAEESHFASLTDADFAAAAKRLPLLRAASVDEVRQALGAGGAGQQPLWKYLAAAAALLAVAEIALARWIVVQRKLGATAPIEFASRTGFAGEVPPGGWDAVRAGHEPKELVR